jgi:hypothetical protein
MSEYNRMTRRALLDHLDSVAAALRESDRPSALEVAALCAAIDRAALDQIRDILAQPDAGLDSLDEVAEVLELAAEQNLQAVRDARRGGPTW